MKQISKYIFLYLFLFLIFSIFGYILLDTEFEFFSYILFYTALNMILMPLARFRWLKIPIIIILLPFHLLILVVELLTPITNWIITIIIVSGIIVIMTNHLPDYLGLHFSPAIKAYLGITLISIILSLYGNKLYEFWLKLGDEKKNYLKVGLRIHNEKRTRFMIFVLYFVMIVVSTLLNLFEKQIFKIERLDYAILQSFATYVAFDRIITTYSSTRIKDKLTEIKIEYLKILKKKFNKVEKGEEKTPDL